MSESKRLKNIALVIGSGITPRRDNKNYWEGGVIPWLKTEQLGEKNIYDTNEKITKFALDDTSIKIFPVNTLSMAMYGEGRTRGNVSILKKEMATNQACCNIVLDKEKADYEYVYYYLKTQYEQLRSLSSGVRKNLNSNDIKEFEIKLPSLSTQQKIAAVLSALDTKIELNQRINAELESMAKTLYDYWFVQFDFPNEKGKPYKSAGGEMVWNEALKREIPLGWDIQKLNSIFDFQKGIEPGSAEYRSAPISSDYIKFFRVGDVDGNTEIYVDATNRDFTIVAERDVVVTFDASVGKTAFGLNGAISGGFRKIYDRKGKFDNALVYFIFKDERILATIHKYATGSILLHASGSIKHLLIVFDEDIVIQFQVFVKPVFDKMVLNRIESQTLTKLRDWLLPMLMNGQVGVTG